MFIYHFCVRYDIVYIGKIMNKAPVKTDAQKRAAEKWEGKFKQRIVRIPFDKDKKLVEYCKKNNKSINGLINNLIDEIINK